MNIFREGNLRNSDPATGDILSVELGESDVRLLERYRYTMHRFSQFRHHRLGWDLMDKAHIDLRRPRGEPDSAENLVTLTLDGGGDLYFSIWESERLRTAAGCEVFPCDEIVGHDPSQKLARLGIEVVRFYGLNKLAYELFAPKFVLPVGDDI